MNSPLNRIMFTTAPRYRRIRTSIALTAAVLGAGLVLSGCLAEFDADPSYDQQVLSDELQTAFVTREWAYAWTQFSTGTFTASNSFARNSAGNVFGEGINNTVTQISTGRYRVTFPGVSSGGSGGGNVQVTAYGASSARCKVRSWGRTGSDVNVNVDCYTANGNPVNTQFSVAYDRKSNTGGTQEAYVWANQSGTDSYTPSLSFQFNSSGATNTIERQDTGRYAVTLPDKSAFSGTVEVTAYGAGSDYCKVLNWIQSGSDAVVNVNCFDSTGAASDSQFTLSFANGININGALSYSYAWANSPTSSSYTPSLSYQEGNIAGDIGDVTTNITAGQISTGLYSVQLPGMSGNGSNVQVTAYGSGSDYCKVVNWGGNEANAQATVACFDDTGAAVDTRFVIVYTDDKFIVL